MTQPSSRALTLILLNLGLWSMPETLANELAPNAAQQKQLRCEQAAALTQQSAEGLSRLEGLSEQEKRQMLIDAGVDPLYEESVADLLLQKQIEYALAHQHAPDTAAQKMVTYCGQFSIKAHYYPDALLSELHEYDDVSATDF